MKEKKFKLKPADKRKWVKALRSGEYTKGVGCLMRRETTTETTYCCLGVAREIGLCKASRGNPDAFVSNTFLPRTIQSDLAGKNDGTLNDFSKPWSFNRIATWIEKNL